jgi:hypothetical protein
LGGWRATHVSLFELTLSSIIVDLCATTEKHDVQGLTSDLPASHSPWVQFYQGLAPNRSETLGALAIEPQRSRDDHVAVLCAAWPATFMQSMRESQPIWPPVLGLNVIDSNAA